MNNTNPENKPRRRRFLLTAVVTLAWVTTFIVTTVFAATLTVIGSFAHAQYFVLSATSNNTTNSTAKANGNIIEVTAKGYVETGKDSCGTPTTTDCADTVTVTIQNSSSATVQFDLSTSGSVTLNGVSDGTGITLDSGASFTFSVTSGTGTSSSVSGSITITNVSAVSTGIDVKTNFQPRIGGTLTVDGTAVTANTPLTQKSDHVYSLNAVPDSGYKFFGWMSSISGMVSQSATHTYTATEGSEDTLWPLFIKTDSAVYYIKDASPKIYYGFFDDAITAAGSNGTIIPYQSETMKSGTMYGSNNTKAFTLSGQTLLIPYAETALTIATETYKDESGKLQSTWEHANATFTSDHYDDGTDANRSVTDILMPDKQVNYTLTIPSGTTLDLGTNAKMVIGGRIVSGYHGTTGVAGATAGAHSNVELNGTLNVNSGGILSVCGFILDNSTGKTGKINVASGGKVYQPFVMMDYHDGHYAVHCTENGTFPANRYALVNIQASLTISYGGQMYGYVDIYTQATSIAITTLSARHNVACAQVVGKADETALLQLTEGATLTSTYDSTKTVTSSTGARGYTDEDKTKIGAVGKTSVTINGGASLGNLQLTITAAIITKTVNSNTTDFPIPYHFDFTLQGGTYTIPSSLCLLPGATMTVAENANLVLSGGHFIVFDGLRDYTSRQMATSDNPNPVKVGSWYEYHYPRTVDFQNAGYNGSANLIVDGTLTVGANAHFGGYVQTNGTGMVIMNGTSGATAGIGVVKSYSTGTDAIDDKINDFAGRTERTLDAWLYKADGSVMTMETGKTYCAVDKSEHTVASYSYILYNTPQVTTTYIGFGTKGSSGNVDYSAETLNADIIGSWGVHSLEQNAENDATCTETGNSAYYSCASCGRLYDDAEGTTKTTEEAVTKEALGHSMTTVAETLPTYQATGNNAYYTCDRCSKHYLDDKGDTETTVEAQTLAKVVQLNGFNVSADAETILELKFLLPAELINVDGATVMVSKRLNEATIGDPVTYKISELPKDKDKEGNERYVVSWGFASGEMTYDLTVTFSNGSGEIVNVRSGDEIGASISRNVLDYASAVLKTGNDKQKSIITALLTYGGYAQLYFETDKDNPAYGLLGDQPNVSSVQADTITQEVTTSGDSIGITQTTQNAHLKSAIYLTVFFELNGGKSIDDYTFILTYPVNGKEYTQELLPVFQSADDSDNPSGSDRYYVDIENIPAAYLDYMYTITVKNTAGDTYVVTTSVLAYLKDLLDKSTDDNQMNLARAMYLYNQAANEFFGK